MIGLLLATALVGSTPALAGTEGVRQANLEPLTHQQLESQLLRLQSSRPRLVGPIVFIAAGGGGALAGLVSLNIGAALVFSKPALVATFLLVGGAVFLVAGVLIAICGIVRLGRRLAERKAIDLEIDDTERRLQTLERLSKLDWVSTNQTVIATF
jgi:hypothetical protein